MRKAGKPKGIIDGDGDFDALLEVGFIYVDESGRVLWDEDIRLFKYYKMQEAIDEKILYYIDGELLIKNS